VRKIFWLLSVAFAAAAATMGFTFFTPSDRATRNPAPLTIAESDLDLGTIWESERHEHTLTIHNPTVKLVEGTLSGTCACLKIEPDHFAIRPGGSQSVRLTINTVASCLDDLGRTRRPFRQRITARIDGASPDSTIVWQIAGQIRAGVAAANCEIDLGQWDAARGSRERKIDLAVVSAVRNLRIVLEGGGCIARLDPDTSSGHRILILRAESASVPGRFQSKVKLIAEDDAGQVLSTRVIPIVWELLADVRTEPAELLFGSVIVGEKVGAEVTVSSRKGHELTLHEWKATSPAVRITVDPKNAEGSSFVIRVEWDVDRERDVSEYVTLTVADAMGSKSAQKIFVSGYGVRP
jgi:hypothetical protein